MPDETETLTIRLLQDMRDSLGRIEEQLDDRLGSLGERLTDLIQRMDSNTVAYNLVADTMRHRRKRIAGLDGDRA